ncbi:LTA synthase family protein [Fusibacter tunisiensis]|uniref:Phosphoglycerol transferase MdoB-like AlkP superfamily enzyme n=1 Tax=Fusibacter tunisiensis TaxID=1008308 RepID=A0ABS2MSU7_9FIRM|nr:LTA synthase family protein [Fusibacter tunisiensis]MBM7562469.1 phosphoglycerol transferase MdoB-like AlkP superfamily enzyme [Fusibacter tunisiensis]
MKNTQYYNFVIKFVFLVGMLSSLVVKAAYIHVTIGLMSDKIFSFLVPSALILIALNILVFQKRAVYSLIATDLIVTLVFFADALYGRYYGIPLTLPILYQVGFVDDVADSTKSLLLLKDLIFILPYPFMIGYAWFFRKVLIQKRKLIETLGAFALIIASVGYFSYAAIEIDRTHHAYERKNIAKDLGVFYFHGYDAVDFAKNRWFVDLDLADSDVKLIDTYLQEKGNKVDSGIHVTGTPNLLIIQVEAMQEFVVDLEIEGEQVTPFLNQLKNDALYFENIYHQVAGGNTSDAEFMTNVGLYPAPVGAVNYLHAGNIYESLPKLLSERGYGRYGFHGYQASFWNREVVYNTLGFDDFISKEDLTIDEILGWAISDASFFRQGLDYSLSKTPFYSFMVTLSSHHPYDAFRGMAPDTGAYENTQVGDYLKSMRYVDGQLEEVFARLGAEGYLEDTIVVVYGDHSGLYTDQKALLSNLLSLEDHIVAWESIQKIPLWIYAPGTELKGVQTKIGGQVDLFATVCDLVDLDPSFTLGTSLLKEGPGHAVKRDGSIFFEEAYYQNNSNMLYNRFTYEPLEITPEWALKIESAKNSLKVSDLILKKNLFKNPEFLEQVRE